VERLSIVCANDKIVIWALFSHNQPSVQDFAHSAIFQTAACLSSNDIAIIARSPSQNIICQSSQKKSIPNNQYELSPN